MKKYYLGVEERTSMTGQAVSRTFLLAERATVDGVRSVFERMFIVTPYGNFEVEIEFRFESDSKFQVINKIDGKKMGEGICAGPFDSPTSMQDTVEIAQTKERETAVFSFDGPSICVGKVYYSLESGNQTGFAVERCSEITREKYDLLKSKPQTLAAAWEECIKVK